MFNNRVRTKKINRENEMKIVVLLSILFLSLFARDCDFKEDIEIQNSAAIRTIQTETGNSEDDIFSTRYSYNNRIEVNFKELGLPVSLYSDIDLYSITNAPGKVKNISLPYDKETNLESGFQINSLYLKANLGEYFSYYHGTVPFKGGRFSEIKDPTINGGNGLAIINNQVYSSDFVSFHSTLDSADFSIILGKSEFNTKNHYNGLLQKNNKSSGDYAIITYESGKHFFEADYYRMTVKTDELDYAKLKIMGIGYIYDDSVDSGFTFYTNVGTSSISENVEGLADQYGIPQYYLPYFASQGAIVKNTHNEKGYAGLFGTNYEFDTEYGTFNIGTEVFITRGGWVSANHGVLFLSDHSWWANRNAIENTIYAGVNITKNLRFSSKFVHTESKDVPIAFSISQNAPKDEAFHGSEFYTRFNKVEFLVNYIF